MGLSLLLKFTNANRESTLHSGQQSFRFRFRKHMISVTLRRAISLNFPDQRIGTKIHCSQKPVDLLKKNLLSENVSWFDLFSLENNVTGLSVLFGTWDELDTRFSPTEWSTCGRSAFASRSCKYSGQTNRARIWSSSKSDSRRCASQCSRQNCMSKLCSVCGRIMVGHVNPRVLQASCLRQNAWAHNLWNCGFGHIANTHMSRICARFNLAGKENRISCGKSCRGKRKNANTKWKCAAHQKSSVWHGARWREHFWTMTKTQSFILSLEPDVKWMPATTTTWTTNADWLCAWEKRVRGRCTVYTLHQLLGNCISCKRKSPIWKDSKKSLFIPCWRFPIPCCHQLLDGCHQVDEEEFLVAAT